MRTPQTVDLDVLYARIFSRPEVMRFVFAGQPLIREQAKACFKSMFDHEGSGLKLGVLVNKQESRVIGFSGLLECQILGERDYEIGFVLARTAWSKGFATEIGLGQLEYGFTKVGCVRLLAQTAPENLVSIAVLEKIGMVFQGTIQSEGRGERNIYVAHRT
ncbi:MAG: GNAT family N-acetyltransferase [Cyanobacteria bacterium J06559_3]